MKLRHPQRVADQLVFTSSEPFGLNEAAAWWQCFDALRAANDELRHVHDLLRDIRGLSFATRSIRGAEDPSRLAEMVRTEGWIPVETGIRVGAVADLVRKLGGEKLYGPDLTVPLRELIQNAADAVRFRQSWETSWARPRAEVIVRVGSDKEGEWVEVEDTGIGMSKDVLIGPFLDFGTSYWGSSLMVREFPGMLSRAFAPTGQYGIGFFSVFMWGERIKITTRRADEAPRSSLVLEFHSGVDSRPILRTADVPEFIHSGGTRVRVWLDPSIGGTAGISDSVKRTGAGTVQSFRALCARLCATLDIDLYFQENDTDPVRLVRGNDWIDMPGEQLLARVWGHDVAISITQIHELVRVAAQNLRIIVDPEGRPMVRACLVPNGFTRFAHSSYPGQINVGGFYALYTHHLAGVLLGESVTAARNLPILKPDPHSAAVWATEQAHLVQALTSDPYQLYDCAQVVWQMGGDISSLPIVFSCDGWKTFSEIAGSGDLPDRIVFSSVAHTTGAPGHGMLSPSDLFPHVFLSNDGGHVIPNGLQRADRTSRNVQPGEHPALARRGYAVGMFAAALAEAWGVSLEEVLINSTVGYQGRPEGIASIAGRRVDVVVSVFNRPKKPILT